MLEHSPVIGIGSNVLVTGSNRGIGLGFVQVLVKTPGVKRIFAACRNPEQAKDLQDLQKTFPGLELIKLDVQSDASVKQAFEHISKAVADEGLNLIINNSAILEKKGAAIEDVDRAVFLRHFDVNTVSVAVLNATFLPLLRKAAVSGGLSRIVNISSDLASVQTTTNCVPLPSGELNVIYGMTKAALNLYTRALAGYEKNNRVVALAVHPGWVRTDMGTQGAKLSVEESTSAVIETISRSTLEHSGYYINRFGEQLPF